MSPFVGRSKWLRGLWAVNGVVLLVFMLVLLAVLAFEQWGDGDYEVAPIDVTPRPEGAQIQPRALRFEVPRPIYGTTTRLVRVSYGESLVAAELAQGLEYWSPRSGRVQPVVNVLFLPTSGEPYLLFDRAAYVIQVNYPSGSADSLQHWIGYEVAFDDSNLDGQLDQRDRPLLMISDLEGRNLNEVLSTDWMVSWYRPFGSAHTVLIVAVARTPDREASAARPQRAFLYDLQTAGLTPYMELDELIDSAGRLVGR